MAHSDITIIFSPYHVGIRDHRVGNGPHRIRSFRLEQYLQNMGVTVRFIEIENVDNYEGEIGRSFEIMRRISKAVSDTVANNSFPLILSGNCMASAAVACGLQAKDLAFLYFDAHDDLDSPDVNENGYFDAMGLSMLRGESWRALMKTVPGFEPFDFSRFLYCGLRDQSDIQKQRVIDAGMRSIWGSTEARVDFAAELKAELRKMNYSPALVHLDLDVLDESYGKVNDYPSPGGLHESDLISCMELVPQLAKPESLTVCSFDPDAGDGDRIATIAVHAIITFVKGLLKAGLLKTSRALASRG
ncbi:arginase [Aspergillus egyptiacus]|nr:arginase [Aspergillus egyptiacus]